jgi:hypothetical protein
MNKRTTISPRWHKTVLKNRLAKVETGKAAFLTLDQLKEKLAKRTKKAD